ncbi:MAG TPA: hypothetical protein VJ644_09785 [Jiangellaceae bacterium]|nr:hypothetical protein [Jiangellaceae bacterium]
MTGGHVAAVVLAEYDEGLLPDRRAADVAAHLAHCRTCTETHRQLVEVSHRLATEPAALPIPPDVAARLDLALAGEKANVAASAAGPVRRRTGAIVGLRPWRARMPTVLAAAAAIAAVAFAGYVVGTGSGDDGGDSQTMVAEGGTDRSSGEVGQPVPSAEASDDTAVEGTAITPQLLQDSRTTLGEQIKAIIATGLTESTAGRESAEDAGDQDESRDPQDADPCGATLAADVGRGLIGAAPTDLSTPSGILVVTAASTDDAAQGWVVPTCDSTAADAVMMVVVPTE